MEAPTVVETEVTEKAKRRTFTAEYKQRILDEADRALGSGESVVVTPRSSTSGNTERRTKS